MCVVLREAGMLCLQAAIQEKLVEKRQEWSTWEQRMELEEESKRRQMTEVSGGVTVHMACQGEQSDQHGYGMSVDPQLTFHIFRGCSV